MHTFIHNTQLDQEEVCYSETVIDGDKKNSSDASRKRSRVATNNADTSTHTSNHTNNNTNNNTVKNKVVWNSFDSIYCYCIIKKLD